MATRGVYAATMAFVVILSGLCQPMLAAGQQQQSLINTAAGPDNPLTADFAVYINKFREEWHIPGMAISVVDGARIFADAYGYESLPDRRASPDTLWFVGSTTKAHTTATLGQIIHSGRYSAAFPLKWQTPISSILREDFVLQNDWSTTHLTLEDAASHRTGLTRHDDSTTYDRNNHSTIVRDIVRNLRHLPATLTPRVTFAYSNLMYTVLTHVIETVTGQWLGDLMNETIWSKLGMDSTFYDREMAEQARGRVSQGYFWHSVEEKFVPMAYLPSDASNGAGAVISTVSDYAKWVQCFLRKGHPLARQVHDEVRTPRSIMYPDGALGTNMDAYALGWVKTELYGKTAYWHSGGTMTHESLVYFFPGENYGITIFTNIVSSALEVPMYRLIEDRFNVANGERFEIEKVIRDRKEHAEKAFANATDLLYPDRPLHPLPYALAIGKYVGTYESRGYGTIDLKVGKTHDDESPLILEGSAINKLFPQSIQLEHISGEFWIAYYYVTGKPQASDAFKAEFKLGSNGAVESLDIEVQDRVNDGVFEGITSYIRC